MPTYRNARGPLQRAQEIFDHADGEGRALTAEERQEVQAIHDSTRLAKSLVELEGGANWTRGQGGAMGKGTGDQFIESKGYKNLLARGLGSGAFSTGQVELHSKATLTGTPGSALTPAATCPGSWRRFTRGSTSPT